MSSLASLGLPFPSANLELDAISHFSVQLVRDKKERENASTLFEYDLTRIATRVPVVIYRSTQSFSYVYWCSQIALECRQSNPLNHKLNDPTSLYIVTLVTTRLKDMGAFSFQFLIRSSLHWFKNLTSQNTVDASCVGVDLHEDLAMITWPSNSSRLWHRDWIAPSLRTPYSPYSLCRQFYSETPRTHQNLPARHCTISVMAGKFWGL